MAKKSAEVQGPPKGRRYVGTRETVGFILYEASREVAINPGGEWVDRVLNISRLQQAVWGPLGTAWDIVNDLFLAALAEKTRTRFGKFRPYLILYPLYGLPMNLLLLALPYIFWGTSNDFMPKIIAHVLMSMFNEFTGTINGIARTGMLANITTDPQERISLITKSKFLSFGSDLPKQIFEVTRDIVSRNTKATPLQVNMNMRTMYTAFGLITITLSCAMSVYFAIVSKERVPPSSHGEEDRPPTVRESLSALKNNRPLFMIMLSEILDGFTIKNQQGVYTDSILNFTNFGNVFGIPGGVISTVSYLYVARLRERFSSKTLWIMSENLYKPVIILIYFFGMIRTKTPGKDNGLYRMYAHLWPMIGVYAISDMVHMAFYGTKRVIPDEIRNEVIDYGEWKNGFRSEAMVGTLRSIPPKITGMLGNTITGLIMDAIGFKTGEGYLDQNEKTADGIFAMATIIPTIAGFISLIPKFFYNINQKDREVMYEELAERRNAAMAAMNRAWEEEYGA